MAVLASCIKIQRVYPTSPAVWEIITTEPNLLYNNPSGHAAKTLRLIPPMAETSPFHLRAAEIGTWDPCMKYIFGNNWRWVGRGSTSWTLLRAKLCGTYKCDVKPHLVGKAASRRGICRREAVEKKVLNPFPTHCFSTSIHPTQVTFPNPLTHIQSSMLVFAY